MPITYPMYVYVISKAEENIDRIIIIKQKENVIYMISCLLIHYECKEIFIHEYF